jgi:hypothetical protein
MARPVDTKLTFKQQFYYKKHQTKKWCKEFKTAWKEDMKENWEGYAIVAGGTFAGFLIFLFWIMYASHDFSSTYGR